MGVYTGIALDGVHIKSGRVGNTRVATGIPAIKTASFTVAATDRFLVVNGASAIVTVTLPAPAANAGRELTIKNLSGTYTVVSASSNVRPANSNTAGTAILAATAGAWATLVSDGAAWVVMAS
jgi:hypothetical protein